MTELFITFDEATLTVNILRSWDRETIKRFALHLLGDAYQDERTRAKAAVEKLKSELRHTWDCRRYTGSLCDCDFKERKESFDCVLKGFIIV